MTGVCVCVCVVEFHRDCELCCGSRSSSSGSLQSSFAAVSAPASGEDISKLLAALLHATGVFLASALFWKRLVNL